MKLLFPLVLFFCGAWMKPQTLTEDQRFKIIVSNESTKVAQELGIYPFGFGVEGPKGVQGIALSYTSKKRLNIEQTRKLVVPLAQKILLGVNNKISTEKLKRNPIDLSFLYFSVNFDGVGTLYNENEGEIAFVNISRGIIEYSIQKPNLHQFTRIYSEPYDDAYRIVLDENKEACFVTPGYSENTSQEIKSANDYRSLLDGGSWLPFKFAIPSHYVVLPGKPNDNIGLNSGFFCGERSTIKDLWKQNEIDPQGNFNPPSACFFMSWSLDNVQRDSSFSLSDQQIRSMLKKKGATSVKISNLTWNNYPVKAAEAIFSPDSHLFLAWVGLNTGGETMKIHYLCPKHSSAFAEETATWNEFLTKTTGISPKEYFSNLTL